MVKEECLKQYVDLYEENKELIDTQSAEVLNRCRPGALATLRSMRLPHKGDENYEVTDLPKLLEPDYGVNVRRVTLPVNPAESFHCGIPRVATSLFFMVNDRFALTPESRAKLPEGVEIESLREMALRNPEIVDKYYNQLADKNNPIAALTALLAQDGLWIRVKRGVHVEDPVQLIDLAGGTDNMMTPVRAIIVMEDDSQMKMLVCNHTASQSKNQLSVSTSEVFVGANALLDLYTMEESEATSARLSGIWLRQEADSGVVINGMVISNGHTRNEYHCRYAGAGASLKLYGMGIADSDRVIDVYSRVDHDCDRCHTDELFKFSVDDRAVCGFTGLVKVAENAVANEAYQSNRNLIGSNEARMMSKPQLEIYNDDVKCSHGSATGQLDELQMFYMRTRGLSRQEAGMLLKQAFMADVIDEVNIPGLKERLAHIVERRFAGELAGCHDCSYSNISKS